MTGLSERIPEAWDTRISSALVADGDRARRTSAYTVGTARPTAVGVSNGRLGRIAGESQPEIPQPFLSRTATACMASDPVCDYNERNLFWNVEVHSRYATSALPGALADRVVAQLRRTAAPSWTHAALSVGEILDKRLTAHGEHPESMRYRWQAPTLAPEWLSLDESGHLTGTPSEAGRWVLVVEVAGNDGRWVPGRLTVDVSLPVPPPEPEPDLTGGPKLVSRNASGAASSYYAFQGTVSANGSKVTWLSPSPELMQRPDPCLDLCRVRTQAAAVNLTSRVIDCAPDNGACVHIQTNTRTIS